jgi:HEAT repeat protein
VTRPALAVAALFAAAAAASAGDVIAEYQKRFRTDMLRDREEVVSELVATGRPEALKALLWCASATKDTLEEAERKSEKAHADLVPAQQAFDEKWRKFVEAEKKAGRGTPTQSDPTWPETRALAKANADSEMAEKVVLRERTLLDEVLGGSGDLIAKLPEDAQKAVRDEWTKTRFAAKDWAVRAESYQVVGRAKVPWATEVLVRAASDGGEPDPRALVVAIDGLGGREPKDVMQPLLVRIDDVRWLVRVAVVAALEKTPAKEGVDALVRRLAKEDGRLRDDCARALRSLTGADIRSNSEQWRIWWEANREKWTGKPPPEAPPTPFTMPGKPAADDSHATVDFLGLKIESRRVVFVIDVSGSMTFPMGGNGPDAKTPRETLAKRELKQAIASLEDGTLFDVVFFSGVVTVWKKEMQKADAKTRKEASDFVDQIEVVGGTNTFDALEAAYALGDLGKGRRRESDPTGDARLDTIVLLSDGRPSQGRTSDPDAIRQAVREWNKTRRIAIHAIAFGAEAKDGADPKFMKGLAEDTGGSYLAK